MEGWPSARLDLPQARKAGRDSQSDEMVWGVLFDLRCERRPRPHEAHLTAEHVDQLRQLVEAVLAKNPPQSRYAGVIGNLEKNRASFIARQQAALQMVGVDNHRSEFVHGERDPVPAYSPGQVENWTACFDADQKSNRRNQRPERQQ